MRFFTESGSIYEIRDDQWFRLTRSKSSGLIRAEQGTIVGRPFVEVGHPAVIEDTSVLEGFDRHFLRTSKVTIIQTGPVD